MTEKQKKNCVFITTPFKYKVFKEAELDWHYANLKAMKENGIEYDIYNITGKSEAELTHDLAKYDAMYVEGGSPFYFMQEAHNNNFGEYVHRRLNKGMLYISESAGSVVAGIDIAANSRPGKSYKDYDLVDTKGFGFVNFVILPHWGQESKKSDYFAYKIPQSYNEDYPIIPLSNNQFVEVEDDWYKIIDIKVQTLP